jgi:pilus assembly protein TadC
MSGEALWTVGVIAAALNVVLLGAVVTLALRQRRLRDDAYAQLHALRDDLAALGAAGVGVGQRLDAVEEKTRRAVERVEQWERTEPLRRSYKQAMQLIDSGANVHELVEECGVTRGEAELLANLHRLGQMAGQ